MQLDLLVKYKFSSAYMFPCVSPRLTSHTQTCERGQGGFPGRRLIVGACSLAGGTEPTSAHGDSPRTTQQQLLNATYSFLPANGGASFCSVTFSP